MACCSSSMITHLIMGMYGYFLRKYVLLVVYLQIIAVLMKVFEHLYYIFISYLNTVLPIGMGFLLLLDLHANLQLVRILAYFDTDRMFWILKIPVFIRFFQYRL